MAVTTFRNTIVFINLNTAALWTNFDNNIIKCVIIICMLSITICFLKKSRRTSTISALGIIFS